jgi:hypothetical protein
VTENSWFSPLSFFELSLEELAAPVNWWMLELEKELLLDALAIGVAITYPFL